MTDMTAMTGDAPAADAPDDMTQGYTIEISVLPDGTFNVSSEPLQEEAAEEQGSTEEGTGKEGQTVKSFGEALKAALDIYKNDGKGGDEQSDFMSGFAPPSSGAPAAPAPPASM